MMTEHLEKLRRRFGENWPAHVVNRIIFLATSIRTVEEDEEYAFLYEWANRTLEHGVMFKMNAAKTEQAS